MMRKKDSCRRQHCVPITVKIMIFGLSWSQNTCCIKEIQSSISQLVSPDVLKPQGAGFPEHLLEGSIEVVSHDGVCRADEFPSDEHGGDRRVATQANERPLDFLPPGVLVHLVEKPLHRMAHAGAALAEYHHCPM